MKRREFLRKAVTGTAGAAAGVTAVAACGGGDRALSDGAPAVITKTRVKWTLVSSFPRGLDTIFGASLVLAEKVALMTDGNFTIDVNAPGELVPGLQVLDAVKSGAAEVGQSASYYYIGKNPVLAFDTCVPFGLTARQQAAWLLGGGGLELLRPVFADFGVLNFPGGNTGVQMGGWFRKEVDSVDDLKGLKVRVPGMGGEVMARLGATVQVLPGGEVYSALERGVLDAAEWVGPYDDEKLGLHKVARYYYYPGWWEPGASLSYYVGLTAWERLPASYKAIFEAAAHESGIQMQVRYDTKNPPALKRLLEHGVELRAFSQEIMEAAQRISTELLEENAAKDPVYRAIYASWKQARDESFAWFGKAELAYASFAFKG
jgi:TRAP-type mannitol/chloroaromatic compound transport system substrate-binding protein